MRKKVLFLMAGLCLCMLTAEHPGWANETQNSTRDDVFTLGEIVVKETAGANNMTIGHTVTAEDIKIMGAVNAAEALNYVPGVNVVRTAKGESNINVHGFGQKDVLILIDGVPYYETKNGPLDLQQIPAAIIGKIEVVKGASSVLYGPNALGGVVNIVTRKGVTGISGQVSAEGGRGGYGRGTASLNFGAENGFSVLGTVDYRTRDDLYFSDDYSPRETNIRYKGPSDGRPNPRIVDDGDKKDNSDLESLNLWTRLGFAPTEKLELYASLFHFDMERGRMFSDVHNKVFNFSDGFSSFGRYDEYKDTGADFGGRFSVNKMWDLRAMAFYHVHEDEYTSYVSEDLAEKIATSTWDDDAYGFSLFSDTYFDRFGALSLSVQYREDKHKQQDAEGADWEHSESNTLTLAAEDTLTLGRFTAVLGLAYHDFDAVEIAELDGYDHDTFDPMAGLSWAGPNGLEIFGSVGKKTRFPTFGDMEDDNVIYKLKPEENMNYTLGARYLFFSQVRTEVSGFFNDIDDRIGEIDDTPANIDKVEIYGVELSTDTQITDRLGFGFNYVYTHGRNKSDDRESDFLEDLPEYTVSANLTYMIPGIETRLILKGIYKDSVIFNTDDNEKEYSKVVDLSLIKDWAGGFSLGAHITNLFDEQYYEGKGMACDGFNAKLVAQYDF